MKSCTYLIIIILFTSVAESRQSPISLKDIHESIENSYPVKDKIEYQQKIAEINSRLSRSGLLPEITASGSASYQSDVTEVPFAGAAAPEFSKDHYSLSLEVNQVLYDGGRTNALAELEYAKGEINKALLNTELWKVHSKAEELFFNILKSDKQLQLTKTVISELDNKITLFKKRVDEGLLLPGTVWSLEAEQFQVKKRMIEITEQRSSLMLILSIVSGLTLSEDVQLEIPSNPNIAGTGNSNVQRPEYTLLEQRKQHLDVQVELTQSRKLPVISLFGRTAYSRPGLDAFNDDLQLYWLAGIRAKWSFRNWKNSSEKNEVLDYERTSIEADQQLLDRLVNSDIITVEKAISSLKKQIALDLEILELRTRIVEEKEAQLEQGVITSTEYVTELNSKNKAVTDLELNKIRLLHAQYELQTKRGKTWK